MSDPVTRKALIVGRDAADWKAIHPLVDQAKGKAVKVIAQRLPFLPQGHRYRVIFMERPLSEVLGSQQAMFERAGAEAGDAETLTATFQRHLDLVQRQLARRGDVELL